MQNNQQPQSQLMVIQLLFGAFSMSIIMLSAVVFFTCKNIETGGPPTSDQSVHDLLFYFGLTVLALVQLAWNKILSTKTASGSSLSSSRQQTEVKLDPAKLSRLFTLIIILLAVTESAAILGFVTLFASQCSYTQGWLLMAGALATYVFRFPKQSKLIELIAAE